MPFADTGSGEATGVGVGVGVGVPGLVMPFANGGSGVGKTAVAGMDKNQVKLV